MIKLKIDGVSNRLWQWDTNRRLVVEGMPSGADIHFSNTSFHDSNALITEIYEEDGLMYASIPNILLQQAGKLYVYPYLEEDESKYTMTRCQISVTERAKPDDYIYTETEIKNYDSVIVRIEKLESENIQVDWSQTDEAAVDYIKNKPEIATDDEIIEMLIKEDMLIAVSDLDGSILSDENGNALIW